MYRNVLKIRNGDIKSRNTSEKKRLLTEVTQREASKGRKALVFFSGLTQQFFIVGLAYGLTIVYPEFTERFHGKRSDAALIQGVFFGLSTAVGVFFTTPIKRLGPGACTTTGALFLFAGFLVSSFVTDLWLVLICVGIVSGTGMGVCYLSGTVAVSWMFLADPRFALSCLSAGAGFGQFILPMLFELFVAEYALSGAFILISAITLHCVPCGIIMFTSRVYYVTKQSEEGCSDESQLSKCSTYYSVLSDGLVWILLTNNLLLSLTASVESWFIVDIMISKGYPREAGSLIVSLTGLANFLGRLLGSIIRFKCKHLPAVTHWIYICLCMTAAHLLMVDQDSYRVIVAICLLESALYGIAMSLGPVMIYEAVGLTKYPNAMALLNVMYGVGDVLVNWLGGLIKDSQGSYNVAFIGSAGASVYMSIGSVLAVCIIRYRARNNNTQQSTVVLNKNITCNF